MSCFACPLPRLWLPRLLVALCAFAAYAARAEPATFLVGSDAVCDFASIQAAVNAAATNPGPDTIHVARNQSYNQQGIDIGAQDVDVIGGFADCGAAAPTGSTVVNGAGGSADSVFEVRGGGIRRFSHLAIANGDETDGDDGGGIDVKGSGIVELTFVTISGSTASRGGGIYAEAQGGSLVFELKTETVVSSNTATGSGGGLYVVGDVDLYVDEPQVLIASNEAGSQGGALYLEGPVVAEIGSGGFGSTGVISGNRARDGGGIAMLATDEDAPILVVESFDPLQPVRIELNRATERGGALYGKGDTGTLFGFGQQYTVRMEGFVIDGNEAPQGGAFFLDNDSALSGEFNGSVTLGSTSTAASRCASPANCNLVVGNRATGSNGAVVFGDPGAFVSATRTTFRNNQGAHLVRLEGFAGNDTADFRARNVAVVDNIATQELFRATGDENEVDLRLSTVAGNAIAGTHVFRFDSSSGKFGLVGAVVEQPGVLTLRHPGGVDDADVDVSLTVSNDVATLPTDAETIAAPARFVDPEHGDYQLQPASAAVDFAPASGSPPERDLANQFRDRELGPKPNRLGTRDLGAFERQALGNLVRNDGFAIDLRLWDLLEPAATTFNAASVDATGGSLNVSVPGPTIVQTVTAARQCVHLPGPGTYAITGRGFGGTVNPLNQDRLVLQWVLRADADDCGGAALAAGELPIVGASGWGAPAAPATVDIGAAQFTANSTLELRLVVNRNPNDPVGNGLFGRFDALSVTFQGDALFRDGFE